MRYWAFYSGRILIKMIYFCEALLSKKDETCPYCGSGRRQLLSQKMRVVDICRCLDCFLIWSNPIFRFPFFYDTLYRQEDLAIGFPSERRLADLVKEGFRNTNKDYNQLIACLKEKYGIRKALDFGSSWGYFMAQLKALGIEAVGVEVSDRMRKFGIRKLNLRIEKDYKPLIDNNEKFDIVFSIHTIEHLKDISLIFKCFYRLLTDRGILFLQVPKVDLKAPKPDFRLIGAVHPLGFTSDFFLHTLAQEGFEVNIYEGYQDLTGEADSHQNDLVVVAYKRG